VTDHLLPKERPAFLFCEGAMSTGSSPWHLRRIGPAGIKAGGGIDTNSLCGRVSVRNGGWDLLVRINAHHLLLACSSCAAQYRAAVKP
jgi:hypothetical protein